MKLESRLAMDIGSMSKYQARDTLAELKTAFEGRSGRIVFQKDTDGKLTGATLDRGFWSGIKAAFSSSYRERRQATEREFGDLYARAAGQVIDGARVMEGLRNDRRSVENADPLGAVLREHGISNHRGVVGQLTPGLMEHSFRGFDLSDRTDRERLEHGLELNGHSREMLLESAKRHGLGVDKAKELYGQIIKQRKQIDELRKVDPQGSAWMEKTPRQCAKELVDSLCSRKVDVCDVMIRLADLHARMDGFCSSNIADNNVLITNILQAPFAHALGNLSPRDLQRLHENIQSNVHFFALSTFPGVGAVDIAVKDIVLERLGIDLLEARGAAMSAATITSGLAPHLGDMMIHLNSMVCDSLGVHNWIPSYLDLPDEGHQRLNELCRGMEFDSDDPKGKAIWATIQLAAVNGGSMRKAVEAYRNGATTAERVAAQLDEAATWGSGTDVDETFKLNFGYILKNSPGTEGEPTHRFLSEMRAFKPRAEDN